MTDLVSSEIGVFIEHYERCRAVTLQFLDVVPSDRLDWRPDDAAFSVGEHLQHIAHTEDYYCRGLFQDAWDPGLLRIDTDAHRPSILRSYFADVHARMTRALKHRTDEDLAIPTAVPNAPGEFPLRWWLWFLLEHEIHHKAQLSVYVRLMGLQAPFYAMPLPLGDRPDIAAREMLQRG